MEIKEETWEVLNTVWLPEEPKSHSRYSLYQSKPSASRQWGSGKQWPWGAG